MIKKICFLIPIVVFACNYGVRFRSPLDEFLTTLEGGININTLKQFKNAPIDSANYYYKAFEGGLMAVWQDSTQADVLNEYFENNKIPDSLGMRANYLIFALHLKLNNEEIDNNKIVEYCKNAMHKSEMEWLGKIRYYESTQNQIMKKNNERWGIDNEMSLVLPVKLENGKMSARYCYSHLTYFDCSGFDDSLVIKGRLIEKNIYTCVNSNKIDTDEIVFKLKIHALSNPRYDIFGEKHRIGDTISIHLSAYGKSIN